MTINQAPEAKKISVIVAGQSWQTAPGCPLTIPILFVNLGRHIEPVHVLVKGIPTDWLEPEGLVITLAPEEHQKVSLVITPSQTFGSPVGCYPVELWIYRRGCQAPDEILKTNLIVAAYKVEGRVGILIDAVQFSVAPGNSSHIIFLLTNQGLEEDIFRLSVNGIPSAWISTAAPTVQLAPGQKQYLSLSINPPRTHEARAGRHPFTLTVDSERVLNSTVAVDCLLTVGSFSEFHSEVTPARVKTGDLLSVHIENLGNIPETYTIRVTSTDQRLTFARLKLNPVDPSEADDSSLPSDRILAVGDALRVQPGENTSVEFAVRVRNRPWLGGSAAWPYNVSVASAASASRTHSGEVLVKSILLTWFLPTALLVFLVLACSCMFLFAAKMSTRTRATQTAQTALAEVVWSTQTSSAAGTQIAACTATASANMTQSALQGQADDDGNGLVNHEEGSLGTDPNHPDTDRDKLGDGDEV